MMTKVLIYFDNKLLYFRPTFIPNNFMQKKVFKKLSLIVRTNIGYLSTPKNLDTIF